MQTVEPPISARGRYLAGRAGQLWQCSSLPDSRTGRQLVPIILMSISDNSNKKRRWLWIAGAIVVLWAGLELVTDFFPEEEKELRREFRNAVEETFPQQAAEAAYSFGLTYYEAEPAGSGSANPSLPSVVLVHGLDDPGKVWMNLAPALNRKKFNVWQLHYPNDQPIEESARFFYDELKRLPQLVTTQLAIVAHSMGGLVAREMLTNPQIAYSDKVRAGEVPRIIGLIMVATPNHGSELRGSACLEHQVRMRFDYDGGGLGKGGDVSLYVDDERVGGGRVDSTLPMFFSLDETTDLGEDSASPVSDDYAPGSNRFGGSIHWVRIDTGAPTDTHDSIGPDERLRIAMARQ